MKTVIVGEQPPEIAAFLARRHALGQDRSDEVWEGDYHVVPAPHPRHSYVDYARHGVEEIGVVDPLTREVRWFALRGSGYDQTGASVLLGVSAGDLAARIDWPG